MIPTCYELLSRAARHFSARPAIRWDGGELSFGHSWDRGLRLATAFGRMGLEPQARVATLEDNRLGAVDAYLGTAAANLVRVPLYPRNSTEAHAHMLSVTNSRVLVVDQDMASEDILRLKRDVPCLETVLVRDGGYEEWLASHPPAEAVPEVSEDDLCIIRFSGGTTGLPKGIPFSNRQWLSQLRDISFIMPPVQPGDVCIHAGTLSHGSGYLFIPTWMAGGVNYLTIGFDPDKIVTLLDEEDVSFGFLAPSQLAALVRSPAGQGRSFPKLKGIWIAGAPVSPETATLSNAVFGERVYLTFSQSELGSPATVMPPGEWLSTIGNSNPIESAGRVGPWTCLEIRSEDNRALATGEIGEIAVRGAGQMTAYFGPPELTDEKIRDGWVLTGDIGYLDENGFLYIVDRKGAMIISGGYNIWPAELERVIGDIPGILEVAVVPVPDERWGETPLAICVVDDGKQVSEQQITEVCRTRLGSYKKPGRVEFRTTRLPLNSVGKIDRKLLKEPHWKGHSKRVLGL